MARGKNQKKQVKEPSLRDKIKAYRRALHGDVAIAFDKKFMEVAGGKDLKKALTDGKDLQAAFVAAKDAADAERKLHPIVEVPNLPEEDEDE
jgi:hypothetical protein